MGQDISQVIVDLQDGMSESHCVTRYEFDGGALVLHLADDRGRRIGVMTYAPDTVRTTTEWWEDDDDDDDEGEGEDEAKYVCYHSNPEKSTLAYATFKVGETTVSVRQDSDGIIIRDESHDWELLQLHPDGVHLYACIGKDAGIELDDSGEGFLRTRRWI